MENLLQETKTPEVGKNGLLAADELRSFSVTISYILVSPRYRYANCHLRYDALWYATYKTLYPYRRNVYVYVGMCM